MGLFKCEENEQGNQYHPDYALGYRVGGVRQHMFLGNSGNEHAKKLRLHSRLRESPHDTQGDIVDAVKKNCAGALQYEHASIHDTNGEECE